MEMKCIIDDALGRAEVESRIKPSSMIQNDEELVAVLEELTTVIRVIGCGGGGSNTIDRLAECGIQGAELYAINTDAQHLLHINADRRFLIAGVPLAAWGPEVCRPLARRRPRRISTR